MGYTNAEFIETAQATFKMSERIHKFKLNTQRNGIEVSGVA